MRFSYICWICSLEDSSYLSKGPHRFVWFESKDILVHSQIYRITHSGHATHLVLVHLHLSLQLT